MKDSKMINALREHFEMMALPPHASQWLLDFYHVIQVFDDMADGENTDRESLDYAIWFSLYSMPSNPFYITYAHELLPAVSELILKWKASDMMERDGKVSEKSYMLRAGYYDLVLKVCQLSFGIAWALKNASLVYSLYAENFEEYKKEFRHA